jgi:YD repeat-containing protein
MQCLRGLSLLCRQVSLPALLAALVAVAMPAAATAQSLFGDTGFSGQRGTYSALPSEHVDPFSGNLIVTVTDLALPGNAGLDLRVTRSYNSKFHRDFEHDDRSVDERSAVGVGWRMHFGRVLHAESTSPGATTIETPDGASGALYQTGAFPEGWITRGFVRYNRATHTAKLPNGVTYVFGHLAESGGPRGDVRYVTSVTDVYGNSLTYTYQGPVPGSITHITQTLGGGQQRDVHFNYHGDGSLATMVYDGRVWTYQHDPASGVPGHTVLRRVLAPAGLPWEYEYTVNGAGPELTALVAPGGGRMTYAYSTVQRRASSLNQSSRVVATRATSGYLITPGTWTFSYNQGANQDTTVVSCPCGTTSYRYNGIGLTGNFAAWASGTLAERRVIDGATTLEIETLTYAASAVISADNVVGDSGVWTDPDVYNALVTQRQLTRGSQTWTTTLHYNAAHYNDYGQAWQTVETGDAGTRISTKTFQYGFTPWIANRVASASVQVGSEGTSSSSTYNLATGFVTASQQGGVTTTFAPTAQGNVGSTTDAHGHTTSLTYSWGVVATTTTPLLSTSRAINQDGSVANETVGTGPSALTTTYAYDLLGRLTLERRPGYPSLSTEILYRYFDPAGLYHWTTAERGARQTTTRLDGFGRPAWTSNFTNVIVRTERDACGRATFVTLPYTSGTPEVGTTTTYDALGRTKTVTDPGGTVTAAYSYPNGDTWVTDAASQVARYGYVGFGGPGERLLTVTDAANQITSYQYDVLNNLTRVTGPTAGGPVRTWAYDAGGRLLATTQPESGATSYQYDAAGRLSQTTDALGRVTTLGYDANDRLLTRDAATTSADLAFEYDAIGRIKRQTIGSLTVGATGTDIVTTTFTFDNAGRPQSRADAVHPGQTFASTYGYDPNDNLTTITYPSGRVVGYTHDSAKEDRLTGVTNNGASFASGFHYDTRGRLDEFYTGPVRQAVAFDSRGRVSGISAGQAGLPQLALTYGYNTLSQVTSIADPRPGMNQAFQYDTLDRL